MNGSKNGFLLATDGIIALGILLIVFAIITNQIFQPAVPRAIYLKQLSLDTLKVLEYDGRIGAALDGNTSAVREVLEFLPVNTCMQLNIESIANGSSVITVARPGCSGFGSQLQTAYRTVVSGGARYIVKMESWFGK